MTIVLLALWIGGAVGVVGLTDEMGERVKWYAAPFWPVWLLLFAALWTFDAAMTWWEARDD